MTSHESRGTLRYWAIAFGSGLIALGGVLGITAPEYWAGTVAVYGIAVADQIKHRSG